MLNVTYRSGLIPKYHPKYDKGCLLVSEQIHSCTVIVSACVLGCLPYSTLPEPILDRLKNNIKAGEPIFTCPKSLVDSSKLFTLLKVCAEIEIISVESDDFASVLEEAKENIERFKNEQS
jgi:hypothetical protein